MSLPGVDQIFELALALRAAFEAAQSNKEQCRTLVDRTDRIAAEIRKMDPAAMQALVRRPVLSELAGTLTSAVELCTQYGKKSYLNRLWSHNSDAEKFDELFKRLDAASQDMQLGLAFDQRAWQLAQKADSAALQKLVAGLGQGQQEIIGAIDLLKKQLLAAATAAAGGDDPGAASAGNPREQWQLDPKEHYSFDKDDDDDKIEIGSGGFGTVFKGTFLGRDPVAIKSVKFKTDKELAAFRAEVSLLFRLSHPNITTLFGASIKGKKGDMVLELFPGSLSNAIYDGGGLPQAQMMSIVMQIAAAMAYLHASSPKVTHRDLKPDNVMVTLKGKAKIIDFGLAATKNSSASSATKLGAAGTVQYMAPELFTGDFTGTHKVDNYAYGILVIEMFAGKPPFEGMNDRQLKHAIVQGSRPDVPPSMPERVKAVIGSCLVPDPRARPEFSAILYALECPKAAADKAPTGSVFRVDNCEVADRNGHYRAKGTYNEKPQYCHVNDQYNGNKEIYWSNQWACDCVRNTQDTAVPPTDGWTKRDGSASSLRIVYM